MKELSLNILDIAENSVKAGAELTQILLNESDDKLTITIKDDGCGMTKEILETVANPFYTTRTTRKVGMGIPLLKLEAELTGGEMEISSKCEKEYPLEHGTVVTALFNKNHIDYTPLGDVVASITTLVQGHPDTDFLFEHEMPDRKVTLDTRKLREVLEGVPLSNYDVIKWIDEYLREQYC